MFARRIVTLLAPRNLRRARFGFGALVLAVGMTALTACATAPSRRVVQGPAPPPPSTEVFFYPTRGQAPAQQERDRYECYVWAVKQTGFDPSAPGLAPHQRVQVVPVPPPGQGAAVGAVAGAALGAITSSPRRATEGAVAGAVAGAMIGAASDAARQAEAERLQQHYEQREARRMARIERQAEKYRRAMAACLEGRGYSVE